jgi:uncharacterized protein involved in outer membrane biogenesis
MKRKWIRRVSWILLTPVLLFVILMILLYIPPVQNLLRREVTAYASKATGMQIQVERIDLRFPLNLLVRGVEVIQQPDTLLSLESLNVRVQAWPLVKGKVEVDEVTLSQVAFNSANLIEGICISVSNTSKTEVRSCSINSSNCSQQTASIPCCFNMAAVKLN